MVDAGVFRGVGACDHQSFARLGRVRELMERRASCRRRVAPRLGAEKRTCGTCAGASDGRSLDERCKDIEAAFGTHVSCTAKTFDIH